jgi:hypothetical protein
MQGLSPVVERTYSPARDLVRGVMQAGDVEVTRPMEAPKPGAKNH